MSRIEKPLTGIERTFAEDDIIVSKTDPTGRITYVNDIFLQVSGYTEDEVLGQPHSLIRHPDTPRSLFEFMWTRIKAGHEVFCYVNNRAKTGDHYWVLAHVTPNFDASGAILGFHSSRRVPRREAIAFIDPLYRQLCEEEQRHANRKDGMQAGGRMLEALLAQRGVSYDRFVLGL
jgi:PAS domain S-box-containing protein